MFVDTPNGWGSTNAHDASGAMVTMMDLNHRAMGISGQSPSHRQPPKRPRYGVESDPAVGTSLEFGKGSFFFGGIS